MQQWAVTQVAQVAAVKMKPHAVVLPPPLLLPLPELLLLPELLPLLDPLLLPELLPLLDPPLLPPLLDPVPRHALPQLCAVQLPTPWSAGAQEELPRIDWQFCDCSADELYVPPGHTQPTKSLQEPS